MSRLSAVATVALTVPAALLVTGLEQQPIAHAGEPVVKPIEVVRVTKVVEVEKVVRARAPVQRPVRPAQAAARPIEVPTR
jgi:peptidoglycan/LPS O-acetylase OafA/YrhL